MPSVEWIGWAASTVLVLTLGRQVYSQWRSGASGGVSRWLFIGQFTASVGFTIYSVLVKNWVFTVTNSMLIVNALLGQWVSSHNRVRAGEKTVPQVQSVSGQGVKRDDQGLAAVELSNAVIESRVD